MHYVLYRPGSVIFGPHASDHDARAMVRYHLRRHFARHMVNPMTDTAARLVERHLVDAIRNGDYDIVRLEQEEG